MNDQKLKELFKSVFNSVASGYDHTVMSFFPKSAAYIPSYLDLSGNEHILDIGTGTGWAALACAKAIPGGHVTGIDFSPGMLDEARKKQEKTGLNNLTFIEMDMTELNFPEHHFDAALCAFSLFFLQDMKSQLIHMKNKVKPGGKILVTTFFDTAFTPLVTLLLDRLSAYGVEVPILSWKRVATENQCIQLFRDVGLVDVKSEQVDCGYYLQSPADWWYISTNGGYKGLLDQLPPDDLSTFKKEHLEEVASLATDKGIRLEMGILFTVGTNRV